MTENAGLGAGWVSFLIFSLLMTAGSAGALHSTPLSLILLLAHSHDTGRHNNVSNHSQYANMTTSEGTEYFYANIMGLLSCRWRWLPRKGRVMAKAKGTELGQSLSRETRVGERDKGRVAVEL